MLKETFFSKEYVGLLSSVCFIFYAFGQLVNGFIGDKIHPKFMIGIVFFTSGIFTFIVPLFNNSLQIKSQEKKFKNQKNFVGK